MVLSYVGTKGIVQPNYIRRVSYDVEMVWDRTNKCMEREK
jgi:hypothetical protein